MLNEDKVIKLIAEEISKNDLLKYVKNDKDFEKRVREIVSEVVIDMFRILWQHSNIFKTLRHG